MPLEPATPPPVTPLIAGLFLSHPIRNGDLANSYCDGCVTEVANDQRVLSFLLCPLLGEFPRRV